MQQVLIMIPRVVNPLHFSKWYKINYIMQHHGHTAAEVIYERADASQPLWDSKSFSGDFPVLKDISIAKNYLNDEELKIRNNIVSGYLISRRFKLCATIPCICRIMWSTLTMF